MLAQQKEDRKAATVAVSFCLRQRRKEWSCHTSQHSLQIFSNGTWLSTTNKSTDNLLPEVDPLFRCGSKADTAHLISLGLASSQLPPWICATRWGLNKPGHLRWDGTLRLCALAEGKDRCRPLVLLPGEALLSWTAAMEDKELLKKLEAGKAKLAQFTQRKAQFLSLICHADSNAQVRWHRDIVD